MYLGSAIDKPTYNHADFRLMIRVDTACGFSFNCVSTNVCVFDFITASGAKEIEVNQLIYVTEAIVKAENIFE